MSKAERTRQFIIEKTAPLFNKKGYHGTSMNEITSITGLTKGSIYGNFKNKDELAIEAYKYNYQFLTEEIRKELGKRRSAVDKLLAFTDFYKNNFARVFELGGCAILNTGTDADDNHPLLKEEVSVSLLGWEQLLKEIISEGISNGDLKRADMKNFPGYFIALVEGSIFIAKTTGKVDFLLRNIERLEKEIKEMVS